ncbi:MAG: hypothetical protein EXS51_01830 [Candidatus Taylorbacteria bacterium]|nr:hypothetical protein [Candidatus Taylorbacteria bacterium]
MKKILIAIVLIAVVVFVVMYFGAPKATEPAVTTDTTATAPAPTDTTARITSDLDAVQVGDPNIDLNALDADINSL